MRKEQRWALTGGGGDATQITVVEGLAARSRGRRQRWRGGRDGAMVVALHTRQAVVNRGGQAEFGGRGRGRGWQEVWRCREQKERVTQ
jgi:hypothetical protein